MATPLPTSFTCFRDAYCSHRRCKPEDFETKVFLQTIQPFRLFPALFFLLIHRRLFAMDLETIRGVGKASDSKDVSRILEEFSNYNRLERGRRRGLFKIRTSGTRLMALYSRYEPMITKPTVDNSVIVGSSVPQARATPSSSIQSSGRLRKIRQVISGLASGRSIQELLAEAELTEAAFMDGLAANSENNPGFAWLRDQILLRSRLESALQEVSELEKTVSSQSRELAKLRDQSQVPSQG